MKIFSNISKAKKVVLITSTTMFLTMILVCTIANLRKTGTIIIDDDSNKFVSYQGKVSDLLKEKDIKLYNHDKIEPSLDSELKDNTEITIKRAAEVTVEYGDTKLPIYTTENNISDMLRDNENVLNDNGIIYNEGVDEVIPSIDTEIKDVTSIKIIKVEHTKYTDTEPIEFETVIEDDPNYDVSYEKVKNEGVNGEKEVTYDVLLKDGVECSKTVYSTKVLSEPVNKVITKGSTDFSVSRGKSDNVSKVMKCIATSYTGDKITATGTVPVRVEGGLSTIAVDPTVIPLGTKVYVDGYGYAVASDTGGLIKGNKIDLFLDTESEALDYGIREVNLTIIAYPGEW